MKIFQFFNQLICASSVTEFPNEQTKLSASTVYLKHYCYRIFFSWFAVRPHLKMALIFRNYNHSWSNIIHGNFRFNFTFYNILIYSRGTFNNRVACWVDFITESLQKGEATSKEFREINILKIPTNRKIYLIVYAKSI